MPMGSEHDETGRLLRARASLILQRDDGGRWRLKVDRSGEALLGARVRVLGTPAEFDMLAVRRIELAE
jgi:hypothetical protein